GNQQRERQNSEIDMDLLGERQIAGQRGRQESRTPPGEQNSQNAAHRREDQAFGEQLPDQPRAPCSESRPQGQFPPASGAAAQQHVGDIGAGDEQQESHGAEKQKQKQLGTTHHLLLERRDKRSQLEIGRELLLQI